MFQIKKCRRRLPNAKNIDAVKKIIYQNKIPLKTNSIMVKIDEMLSTIVKIILNNRKHNEKKEALRKKNFIKNLISFITNIIMKNLIRKIKVLMLQIIII